MKSEYTKLEIAKSQLVLGHPFFASLLLKWGLTSRPDIPTLAVNGRGHIFYNEGYVNALTTPEIVFGFAHEVLHVAFQHSGRKGARDHKRWNIACDAVINETLIAEGVGVMPEGWVRFPNAQNMCAEEVYDLIPETTGEDEGECGIGDDMLEGEGEGGLSEAEASEIEAGLKLALIQAAQAAQMAGKLPKGIARMVEAWLNVKTPWHQVLERFMVELVRSNEYSWARPNRRFLGLGLYLPGHTREPKMGEVVIVVDTSGSIDEETLARFGGHVNAILEQCSPERVRVLYCDTQVNLVEEFTPEDGEIQLRAVGGGGTDLEQAWAWLSNEGATPEVAIVLTDMYTSFTTAPPFPVVWAATTDRVAPYGITLQVWE
jgi:predicted metal-dependent peptidase